MNITEFTPTGWAKDKFLKDEILDTLDLTTEQDFIYAIFHRSGQCFKNSCNRVRRRPRGLGCCQSLGGIRQR